MEKFEIQPRQRQISAMVKISTDKANDIRAILMTALYVGTENKIEDSFELWDYIMNSALDRIDQTNIGEVLYVGMKYGEFVEEISMGSVYSLLRTVADIAQGEKDFNVILLKLKPTLKSY